MLYATKAGAGPTPFKRVPQFLVTLLQPAGVPTWAGSIAVGQLETTHQRRAARSRHQLLLTLHKNSWAFSSYVVRPYNSEKDERTPEPAVLRISSCIGSDPAPRRFATQPRSSRLSNLS